MTINNLKYNKIVIFSIFLSILNLMLNTPVATAGVKEEQDSSLIKISSLEQRENQSLNLHLILAHSFKHQTKTIDLQQDNFELSKSEQTIPLRNQPLIASTFGGKASWYGPGFHGRLTANGERYNQNAMTAAHRYLKFGTRVRVRNLNNGRSVVVRINDRGPFIKGRVIDLSAAAAYSLKMIHSGVAPVEITVLGR